MSEFDFSVMRPFMEAYAPIRELCEVMQSGTIPSGKDAAAAWLSSASDQWIVKAADLLDAMEPVPEDTTDELPPGAAALTIVMLLSVWEGVEPDRFDDYALLARMASRLLILVTWEMARRSGAGSYELVGPLLLDLDSEPVVWKRRPSLDDLEKCFKWRRGVFAN